MTATTPLLNKPRRTEAEALAGVPREECAEARTVVRIVPAHGGMDRRAFLRADEAMRTMLEEALAENRPGWPHINDVRVTGRLTPRQWSLALTLPEFASADFLPYDRCPDGHPRIRTREWRGTDWLRSTDLSGEGTERAVCTLTAHAAGKDFKVEIIADDTAPILI